ncbi:MAG: MFS transporter, partial [Chromatiales bacterium]
MANWLSKQRTIARPNFNRWLVPPAALAIHLSIGMAYGFSVFWIPLEHAVGISESVPCDTDTADGIVDSLRGILGYSDSGPCDWQRSALGWLYTLFFVFLGSSAAVFGQWVEREGPRKAGVYASCCWAGGFLISATGVYWHHIWLLWLGSGVIGGIGLGLGYISPVSTLIKWFPDRRGMATGMAIMGFGGGAMIGAPLADLLMKYYAGPDSVGVWETFVTLSAIYFVAMMGGAFGYRVPPLGWAPPGWQPKPNRKILQGVLYGRSVVAPPGWQPSPNRNGMITTGHVHLNMAHKTPHFWLLWG